MRKKEWPTVRIEPQLKAEMDALCDRFRLSKKAVLGMAVTQFIERAKRDGIIFRIDDKPGEQEAPKGQSSSVAATVHAAENGKRRCRNGGGMLIEEQAS